MKIIPAILADDAVRDLIQDSGMRCQTIVSSFAAGWFPAKVLHFEATAR